MSCAWPGGAWNCAAAAAPATRSTRLAEPFPPVRICSPKSGSNGSRRHSPLTHIGRRNDLGCVTDNGRRLPVTPIGPAANRDAAAHRHPGHRRPGRSARDQNARPDAEQTAGDIPAYFHRPGTSNGPTEAINGRLEHLRGSALGFRNLTNYIARSLLEADGFRPGLHLRLR